MRRLFALAFAVSLAGCSESYGPTAPDPVPPVPAAVQDPDAPGGTLRAAEACPDPPFVCDVPPTSYGVDSVPDGCNTAATIVPGGAAKKDEINTATDRDAYKFVSDPAETNYRYRANGVDGPLPVKCQLRRWENNQWRLLYTEPAGMDCDFSYRSPASRTYCVTVEGLDGAYGPDGVAVFVNG